MKKHSLTMALMAVSAVMIITGVLDQQNQTVMAKAIKICLECIGIG